jgi:hypothetical protein
MWESSQTYAHYLNGEIRSESTGPIRFCTAVLPAHSNFLCCDCAYKKTMVALQLFPTSPALLFVYIVPRPSHPQARPCVELNPRSRPFVGPTQRRPAAPFGFHLKKGTAAGPNPPTRWSSNDFAQTAPAITPHTAPVPITSTSPKAQLQSTRCPTVPSPGTLPWLSSSARHSARSAALADYVQEDHQDQRPFVRPDSAGLRPLSLQEDQVRRQAASGTGPPAAFRRRTSGSPV